MWRSVLLGVVLAGLLAGCNRDGPSGGLTGGGGAMTSALSEGQTDNAAAPITTQARLELARIRLRSLSELPAIGALRCVKKDGVVACRGTTRDGAAMVAKFQVRADGSLQGAACVGWGSAQASNEWGYEYQLHNPRLQCPVS